MFRSIACEGKWGQRRGWEMGCGFFDANLKWQSINDCFTFGTLEIQDQVFWLKRILCGFLFELWFQRKHHHQATTTNTKQCENHHVKSVLNSQDHLPPPPTSHVRKKAPFYPPPWLPMWKNSLPWKRISFVSIKGPKKIIYSGMSNDQDHHLPW